MRAAIGDRFRDRQTAAAGGVVNLTRRFSRRPSRFGGQSAGRALPGNPTSTNASSMNPRATFVLAEPEPELDVSDHRLIASEKSPDAQATRPNTLFRSSAAIEARETIPDAAAASPISAVETARSRM